MGVVGRCRRVKREGSLTYGAPYGRSVEMGRLRLRHRADGAQGVVQLGGGGNSIPGESAVFVVTATTSTTSTTAAAAAAVVAATTSAAAVSTTVCATAAPAAATEFAQELVLVLDAPFTRPQLQHRRRNLKSKFASWRDI